MVQENVLKEYIKSPIIEGRPGLWTVEVYTGGGKTYNSARAIAEYVKTSSSDKKIIFLTTLLKNLPEEELINAFGGEKEYHRNCLRILSNFDQVVEKINDVEIPSSLEFKYLKGLQENVRKYRRIVSSSRKDPDYEKTLRENVEKSERYFRHEIINLLNRNFKNKRSKKEAVKNDPRYQWIAELYPAVFTDDYKVLIMSVSKFLKKNTVLIEPSYYFLKAKFIEGATVFIDEFDATKETILNILIEQSSRMRLDYFNLFKSLRNGLNKEDYSKNLLDASKEADSNTEGSRYRFSSLQEEAEKIENSYHTGLSYKMKESSIDGRQAFLFSDSSFYSVFPGNTHYITASKNDAENRVEIEFYDKYKKFSDGDRRIVIYTLLRSIAKFLNRFKVYLAQWAVEYVKIVNSGREEIQEKMSIEDGVSTILGKLKLSEEQIALLTSDYNITDRTMTGTLLEDTSYFHNGFRYYELEDGDSHNEDTRLYYVDLYDTPEKILLYLAGKATVIGISATAEIDTAVGNYSFKWLGENLGDDLHLTDGTLLEQLQKELDEKCEAYDNGQISIQTQVLRSHTKGMDLAEKCRELFEDEDLAELIYRKTLTSAVSSLNENARDYYFCRYINIFKCFYEFLKHEDIRSMLYLGMMLARDSRAKMDRELIESVFRQLKKYLGLNKEKISIEFLDGDDYEDRKKDILDRLTDGEKILVMSSYQTVGAGQNLQYKIPEGIRTVMLGEQTDSDRRYSNKDFDAIYLGEITNLAVNFSDEKLDPAELEKALIDIEELHANDELSYTEKEYYIRNAFKVFAGTAEYVSNNLKSKKSIRLQATRTVIQAIGRLSRTFVKNPVIYIYADSALLSILDPSEIRKRVISPEMKAIAELAENLYEPYSSDEINYINQAERVASEGHWRIKKILSKDWNENSMQVWKELREFVMKWPTVTAEMMKKDPLFAYYYITSGKKMNEYLYSQYSDFKEVIIDFGNDAEAFKQKRHLLKIAGSEEVIVSSVSEENSRLPNILKYPGIKEYFAEKGYAIHFEKNEYVCSPILFNNIYKGALGETAGTFILERELGVKLEDIQDPSKFEFFDFELAEDVYIDFKNWKFNYLVDKESIMQNIIEKMNKIRARRVYVINIMEEDIFKGITTRDDRIVLIPALIDRDGKVNHKNLKLFKEEDIEHAHNKNQCDL